MEHTFSAFVVREVDGSYEGTIETKHVDDLRGRRPDSCHVLMRQL
ncbi:hypothetical protein OVA29_00940 [Exiguobacterium sp. SL14]|nr:hypothetical protein [Exiguobacterium sp. SL14]MCY1689600.1 hypothetical protein [Exiguobacterium sp. SL14]